MVNSGCETRFYYFKKKNLKIIICVIGCNLSPLLFSIFIDSLGYELNNTNLGISLGNVNISSLFFADDIVILGKNKAALDSLMDITRKFFKSHHLELSASKSKTLSFEATTGETIFAGDQDLDPISLQQVACFKYLGVTVSSSSYRFFSAHNERVKAKARQYLQSVLSLVRTGPDRVDLAFTLWSSCALPAILYGCEVVPLNQGTINEIENCQARVGKFMLQVQNSSSSVCSNIDAGFRPVWAVIAERVMIYASRLMDKHPSNWTKLALQEHLDNPTNSNYMKYLNRWKDATNSFGVPQSQIRRNVYHYAVKDVLDRQRITSTSAFAMNGPGTVPGSRWFQPKKWVKDSAFTKIFAEFRTCNVRLGNRCPTLDGRFFKLCPLCQSKGEAALNNEVII